jgi:hypothetical protein
VERTVHALKIIAIKYNLNISVNRTKSMAVKGKMDAVTGIDTPVIEQVHNCNCLGYTICNNKEHRLTNKNE